MYQVDRHVRLLDQSIKEQEARLGIGPRPPGLFMPPVSGRRGGQANADAVPSSINLDEQAFREQSVDAPPSRPHGRASRTGRSARPMVSSTNVDNAVMEVSEHAQNISQKVLLRGSNDRIGPMEGGPPGPRGTLSNGKWTTY